MFWPCDQILYPLVSYSVESYLKKINWIYHMQHSIVQLNLYLYVLLYYLHNFVCVLLKVEKNDLFDFTQSMIRSFDMDTPLYLYLIWTSEKEIYRKRKNAQNTDSLRPLKSSKIESGAYNHM